MTRGRQHRKTFVTLLDALLAYVSISLSKAAKFSEASIQDALLSVGSNGTKVSFAEWTLPLRVEDNSTVVVAVTSLPMFESEGNFQVNSSWYFFKTRAQAL